MKKRLFALLFALCLLCALLPVSSLSASALTGGDWEYNVLSDGTAEITAYHGSDIDLRVPDSIGTHSVTSIAYAAFSSASAVKSVALPTSLKSIGAAAFYDCTALKAICFTGAAPSIGSNAFATAKTSVIPGLTLYYLEGTSGWTAPTYLGYPTAVWDGVTPPRQPGASDFTDVKSGAWYYAAVDFAVKKGLFNGTSPTTFAPDTPMTRAMLVTVLWRYENVPKPAGSASFTDVAGGKWYTDAVLWAAENGIVNGVGGGSFDPMGKVTREQMAAILFRYCAGKHINTEKRGDLSSFPDAQLIGSYAKDALSWAVSEGYIGGSKLGSINYLDPKGSATRAQVATILMRFLESHQ